MLFSGQAYGGGKRNRGGNVIEKKKRRKREWRLVRWRCG